MKILITGTSSGIGKATLEHLREVGHDVRGISGHSELDVSKREKVRAYALSLRQEGWIPNVLILNAGIFPDDVRPDFNREVLDKVFAVNVGGAINFIAEFLPNLLANKGQVIGIASVAAWRSNLRGIAYPASKAALARILEGFDLHYRRRGVAFSTVYLGPTATRMWEGKQSFVVASPEAVARMLEKLTRSRKSKVYFPIFATLLVRILILIPDGLYLHMRKYLLK